MKLRYTLTFLLSVLATLLSAQTPEWSQFPSQPGSTDRSDDIFFISETVGWAIKRGAAGNYIYKTTDGGESWITQFNQPSASTHFRALGFVNDTRGWVGNLGQGSFSSASDTTPLYETFDGGTTWTAVPGLPSNIIGICAIHVLDNNTIFAGGRVRGPGDGNDPSNFTNLLKSTDQGATWQVINVNDGSVGAGQGLNGIMDVYFHDANNGFLIGMEDVPYTSGGGTYRGRIIRTTDGGATWSPVVTSDVTGTYFWKISFPSPGIGYASLQQNNAYSTVIYYKSTDGGLSWVRDDIPLSSLSPQPSSFFVQGIGCVDDNTCWIGGSGNTSTNYIETTDGGNTWTNVTYSDTRRMNKFRFLNSNFGVSCGARLHVYRAPQTASGDEPCTAGYLVADGSTVTGSISDDLTQTSGVPVPTLFSNTGSTDAAIFNTDNVCEDRWYRVTVPASGGFRVTMDAISGSTDLAIAAYTGNCSGSTASGFALIGADDGTQEPEISISCQTPGDDVFLRVWEFGCNGTSSFNMVVEDIANVAVGDEPETAPTLIVNHPSAPESAFSTFNFNGDYFETKQENRMPTCADYNYANGCEDIWFKFDMPATGLLHIEVDNTSSVYWTQLALYDMQCGITEVACSAGATRYPRIDYNATVGDELYLRVYDYDCNMEDQDISRTLNVRGFMDYVPGSGVCAGAGDGDEPCDAPCIQVGGAGENAVIDATLSQTASGIPDPTEFSNTGTSAQVWNPANVCEDRWYRVAVPASGGFHADFSGSSDLAVAVYNGSCDNLDNPLGFSQIGADDGLNIPSITVGCQTPGDTLYMRVWHWNCSNLSGSSVITLTDLNQQPDGDEPDSAIGLTVDAPALAASLTTVYSESKYPGLPNSCQNGASDGVFTYTSGCEDIWYEVTAPAGEFLKYSITNPSGGSSDLNMALYLGDCPSNLNQVACDVDGGTGSNPEIVYFSNPGGVFYLRVWESGCDFTSAVNFDISVSIDSDPNDLPLCSTQVIPMETSVEIIVAQGQSNAAITFPSIPDPMGCSDMLTNSWTAEAAAAREDSWVQFVVPASGAVKITGESTVPAGDAELAVYATDPNNPCLPDVLLACDGDTGGAGLATIVMDCLTPGEALYIRSWDKGTDNSFLFDLFITENIDAGDDPTNAISAAVGSVVTVNPATVHHSWSNTAPSCGSFNTANACEDTWYETTVGSSGAIDLEIQNNSGEKAIAVYTGTCYDNLSEIACANSSAGVLLITGRTTGEQLLIRLWDENCDDSSVFDLAIGGGADGTCTFPYDGDDPCGAPCVVVGAATLNGSIDATLTETIGVPTPGLFSNTTLSDASIFDSANVCEDRWFRVEVPSSGAVKINIEGTSGSQTLAAAAYLGVCAGSSASGFSLIAADAGGNSPELTLSCQSPGDDIYLRVWETGCDGTAGFTVSASDVATQITGDVPETAINLLVNASTAPESTFTSHTLDGSFSETKENGTVASCPYFDFENGCEDIWFKFVAPETNVVHIEVNNTSSADWTQLALYDTQCGFTEIACSAGQTGYPRIDFNATLGNEYYLRVYDHSCNLENEDASRKLSVRAYLEYCAPDYKSGSNGALSGTVNTGGLYSLDYEANGSIESTQTITGAGTTVSYDSGTDICLDSGFEISTGSEFQALIDGCGGSTRNANENNIINKLKPGKQKKQKKQFRQQVK